MKISKEDAVAMLRGGRKGIAEWNLVARSKRPFPDLSAADLGCVDLAGADLSRAKLIGADLSRAKLVLANLRAVELNQADLSEADLSEADLSAAGIGTANLSGARLSRANLRGADLRGSDLSDANLGGADLSHADITGSRTSGVQLGSSSLVDLDISPLCDDQVQHAAPSTVDWRSIIQSVKTPRPILHRFLTATGMPDVFATYMIDCALSIDPEERFSMLQSTFISYGGDDEEFAEQLRNDLHKNGVDTWFFPDDAEYGTRLHRVMRQGIENYDRVILICSESSLQRPGVLNELELALEKEASLSGQELLIPVAIDAAVYSDWAPDDRKDLMDALARRVVANFRTDDEYKKNFPRLLKALKKKASPGGV